MLATANLLSNPLACGYVDQFMKGILNTPTDTCPNSTETGYGRQEEPLNASSTALLAKYAGLSAPRPLLKGATPDVLLAKKLNTVLQAEGATYVWLWQAIRNIKYYWSCSKAFGGNLDGYLIPAGWQPVGGTPAAPGGAPINPGLYNVIEEDGKSYPIMAVLKQPATKQLVVLIRGTNTQFEWKLDLMYNRTAAAKFGGASDGSTPFAGDQWDGETHYGFTLLAQALWPDLQSMLQYEIITADKAKRPVSMIVAGHSLGGSVANLLAFAARRYLKAMKVNTVRVQAVSFGSASVGNTAFKKAFKSLGITPRRIVFENDLFPLLPCTSPPLTGLAAVIGGASAMPACANTVVPVANPQGLTTWRDYQAMPGSIDFKASAMPAQADTWGGTGEVSIDNNAKFAKNNMAVHVCSYRCFFRKYAQAPAGDSNNCLLVNPPEAGNTFCTGFP